MRVRMFGKVWEIVSQIPNVASPSKKAHAERVFLPELIKAWDDVERVTGYRWRCTSYWRLSPSHKEGYALDIAPDIHENSKRYYAVTHMSDPVLYKREKLMRQLQQLNDLPTKSKFTLGMYVEPDHIHMHVLQKEGNQTYRIFKWGIVKPVYKDSAVRSKLPMITKGI